MVYYTILEALLVVITNMCIGLEKVWFIQEALGVVFLYKGSENREICNMVGYCYEYIVDVNRPIGGFL